jgi:hypothetical protein
MKIKFIISLLVLNAIFSIKINDVDAIDIETDRPEVTCKLF